ncbi:hypothetical protein H4S01_004001 [Coemansia sp. RSA 2610]|nr:hypothetical protein H4S01_004001 [Coemansia sp. RSA 2610]
MAYRVLDLRPDTALLNPQFDGYRLRLLDRDGEGEQDAVRSYPLPTSSVVEPQHLATNALLTYSEVYSRVHFNHMFVGPRPGTIIYIDRERHVHLAEIRKRDPPRITRMFQIPPSATTHALSGYHGAHAIGKDTVLVFDGVVSVYVLQHAPNDELEQWTATGVFEVGPGSIAAGPPAETSERRSMYYIVGAHLTTVEGRPVIQLHACYRTYKETEYAVTTASVAGQYADLAVPPSARQRSAPVFCIQAIQVDAPQLPNKLPGFAGPSSATLNIPVVAASVVHTLHSHAIPVYCEYFGHEQYVLGVRGGIALDDTELMAQPPAGGTPPITAATAMHVEPDPYYWMQSASDVTVCINLPEVVQANQIICELARSSLSLRFVESDKCAARYTFECRQLCDHIIADESVWTLENGRLLTLYLQKQHEGARWASVFRGDDGVLETMDPSDFAVIRERLEKYTASELETGTASAPLMQPYVDQDSGGDLEQLDESSDTPVMFSVRSWRTGQAAASSVAGSPDWLCSAFPRAPQHWPTCTLLPVCLKFDVDGVVFGFDASADTAQPPAADGPPTHANVCARHAGTFSALSYIQAGKREKRFMYVDSDLTVAVLAETQRRVYIYHQITQPDATLAVQNVVDLGGAGDDAEILGIQLVSRALVVLHKRSLSVINLDLC